MLIAFCFGPHDAELACLTANMILIFSSLFVMALSASCAERTVESSCPSDAVNLVGSKYFRVRNGNCFLFMAYDPVLYETANKKCKSNGGILAMPKTKDINDFLLQEMKKLKKLQPMWIGMNDKAEEGTMVWEDGSKVDAWDNFDWTNGGLLGFTEDCVALDPNNGKWNDYGCSNTGALAFFGVARNEKLPFICQYPIKDDSLGGVNGDQDDGDRLGKGDQGIGDGVGKADKPIGANVAKVDRGVGDDTVKGDQKDEDDKGIGDQDTALDTGKGDKKDDDDKRNGDLDAGTDVSKADQANSDDVRKGQGDGKNVTKIDQGIPDLDQGDKGDQDNGDDVGNGSRDVWDGNNVTKSDQGVGNDYITRDQDVGLFYINIL